MNSTVRLALVLVLLAMLGTVLPSSLYAQDLEPRRWSHLPTGLHVLGLGTGLTTGDIFFDPVLQIEDADYELYGHGLVYLYSFGLFGRSARFDVLAPYAMGRWEGILEGNPASTRRHGFGDPRFRLSVLLWGGEALTPQEFATATRSNTVVGAALSLVAPWGEYYPERLINLGGNRLVVRPQFGITHVRNKWTYELTASAFLFGDNDRFNGDRRLKQDPVWAIQGHLIHTFRPGLWASLSTAYGFGGDSRVNGVDRDAPVGNWLTSVAVSIPISRVQGMKVAWIRNRTQEPNGIDFDSFNVAWSYIFGL